MHGGHEEWRVCPARADPTAAPRRTSSVVSRHVIVQGSGKKRFSVVAMSPKTRMPTRQELEALLASLKGSQYDELAARVVPKPQRPPKAAQRRPGPVMIKASSLRGESAKGPRRRGGRLAGEREVVPAPMFVSAGIVGGDGNSGDEAVGGEGGETDGVGMEDADADADASATGDVCSTQSSAALFSGVRARGISAIPK